MVTVIVGKTWVTVINKPEGSEEEFKVLVKIPTAKPKAKPKPEEPSRFPVPWDV